MSAKRASAVAAAIFIAAGLFMVGLGLWQRFLKTGLPSGWEVYQSGEGFRIAFPAGWETTESEGAVRFRDPTQDFLWLAIGFGSTVPHGEEFVREVKREEVEIDGFLTQAHFVEIDPDLFLQKHFTDEYTLVMDNKLAFSLVRKEGMEYFFELAYRRPEDEALLDQFVSTFRF